MSLEHEPKRPPEEQKVIEELQNLAERYKSWISADEQGDYYHVQGMDTAARGSDNIEEAIEKNAIMTYLGNFPFMLVNIPGTKGPGGLDEQTGGRFSRDIASAIEEAGVNKQDIEDYVSKLASRGLNMNAVDLNLHRTLILPVFIKMKEKGYDESSIRA